MLLNYDPQKLLTCAPISIKVEDVVQVYSGKPGCMCGCNGKHHYAERYRGQGKALTGYDPGDDAFNDRSVAIIVAKLNKLGLPPEFPETREEYVTVEIQTGKNSWRVYAAYLKPAFKGLVEPTDA